MSPRQRRYTGVLVLLLSIVTALGLPTADRAMAGGQLTISSLNPVSGPAGTVIDVSGDLDTGEYCSSASATATLYDGSGRSLVSKVVPLGLTYQVTLTVASDALPGQGKVVVAYLDNPGFCNDSQSAVFTVTLVAQNFSGSTRHDTNLRIDLAPHVVGNAGTSPTYEIPSAPAHGTDAVSGSVVTYTPAAGYGGADQFSWRVCGVVGDKTVCSDPAIVGLTVTPSALAVTASAEPPTACTDRQVQSTAVVHVDGMASVGVSVTFVTTLGGRQQHFSGVTDQTGLATFTYGWTAPGTETWTASVTPPPATSGQATASGQRAWTACDVVLVVAPDGGRSQVGSTFTESVAVTYRAAPVKATVTLVPSLSGATGTAQDITTDADGHANVAFPCLSPGTLTIAGHAVVDGRPGDGFAKHICEPVPPGPVLGVNLAPSGTESLTGQSVTFTAVVTSDGTALPGASVTFGAHLGAQPDQAATTTSGVNGIATFTYTRATEGTDTVTVRVSKDGRSTTTQVEHFWRTVPGLALALTPDGTSSQVGQQFTATLTVTVKGRPLVGGAVVFTANGNNQPNVTAARTSGSAGTAIFTYTRAAPDLDSVNATVTLPDGRHGAVSVAHSWQDAGLTALRPPTVRTNRPSTLPGGPVTVSGSQCPALSPVTFSVASTELGRATADASGRFTVTLHTPTLRAGHYLLTAACGGRSAAAGLDLVTQTSSTGTSGAAATTMATILTFFVLLGGQLLRPSSHPVPNTPAI